MQEQQQTNGEGDLDNYSDEANSTGNEFSTLVEDEPQQSSDLEEWWRKYNVLFQGVMNIQKIKISLIVVIALLLCGCLFFLFYFFQHTTISTQPLLILISIDGFRADYLEKYENVTTTLRKLAETGVKVNYLKPSFPTITFPNHYTIVTGLYPESHGIIGNTMYDDVFNATFSYTTDSVKDGRWYGGEPFWVTVRKNNMKSATMFWPGSEAKIGNMTPDYFVPYNNSMTYQQRIEKIISWLRLESERPSFVTFYLEGVDHAGHIYGPDSIQVEMSIKEVDDSIEKLHTMVEELKLPCTIHYIILSDHGMAEVGNGQVINLNDCINASTIKFVFLGPTTGIFPQEDDMIDVLVEQLKACSTHITVYKKEEVPSYLHYSHNRRIPPILCLAEMGWTITQGNFTGKGVHGYNNSESSMRSFFISTGPKFKTGTYPISFNNTDVMSLMAYILDIPPPENNGTIDNVKSFLSG